MFDLGRRLIRKAGRLILRQHRNQRGNTAMTFALAMMPMLAAVGLAVDGGRAFLVKSQLSSAVDVTALSAARLFTDPQRDTKAKQFFSANFSADLGDVTLNPVIITPSTSGATKMVTVTASARVPTLFMRLFGIDSVTVGEDAKAARTDYPIELTMALDNTGSMALDIGGGISRLSALKTAAKNLVDAMYGANENNAQIRIGIIPYTAYANVGRLLEAGYVQSMPGYTDRPVTDPLGWKGCVDADDSNPAAPDDINDAAWNTAWDTKESRAGHPIKPALYPSFVITYDQFHAAYTWTDAGETCSGFVSQHICDTRVTVPTTQCMEGTCITRQVANDNFNTCYDTSCTPRAAASVPVAASTSQEWIGAHPYNTGGNDALFGRANPFPVGLTMGAGMSNYRYLVDPAWHAPLVYPSRLTDRSSVMPALVERTADNYDNATEWITQDSNNDGASASPNTYCPEQALPLAAHSKTGLKTYIDNQLKAFAPDWGTLSNIGLLWGWRMVSADLPLAAQAGGAGFNKAVVLMTDGEMFHPGGAEHSYWRHDVMRTAYGFGSEGKLTGNANSPRADLVKSLYNRLRKTCENMRQDGITVYTITLDPTMSAASKDIYRDCATAPGLYYDAPDAATLTAAFAAIADNLAGVRLVE